MRMRTYWDDYQAMLGLAAAGSTARQIEAAGRWLMSLGHWIEFSPWPSSPLNLFPILHLHLYPSFPPPQTWVLLHYVSSPLLKEKSKWEGKQNSLESELMELHETMASLQSRLRRAELQRMEAQVKCYWFQGGVCLRSSPLGPPWPVVMCPTSFSKSISSSGCLHVPGGHY